LEEVAPLLLELLLPPWAHLPLSMRALLGTPAAPTAQAQPGVVKESAPLQALLLQHLVRMLLQLARPTTLPTAWRWLLLMEAHPPGGVRMRTAAVPQLGLLGASSVVDRCEPLALPHALARA
jgi:hypothetical protein